MRIANIATASRLAGCSYAQAYRNFHSGRWGEIIIERHRQHVAVASIERAEHRSFTDEQIATASKHSSDRRPIGRPRVVRYTRAQVDEFIVRAKLEATLEAMSASKASLDQKLKEHDKKWQARLREAIDNAVRQRDREHAEWHRSRVLQAVNPLGPPISPI
jgi:hypothetical protein